MKKKLLWGLLILSLILSSVSCNSTQDETEKTVREEVAEDLQDVKVDNDSGEVTFTDKDGEKVVYGSTEWPKTDIAKTIPEFTKGTIMSVISNKEGALIDIDQVEEKDFQEYLEEVKKNYSEDAVEGNSDGIFTYSAGNGSGILVLVNYDSEMGVMDISLSKMMD